MTAHHRENLADVLGVEPALVTARQVARFDGFLRAVENAAVARELDELLAAGPPETTWTHRVLPVWTRRQITSWLITRRGQVHARSRTTTSSV